MGGGGGGAPPAALRALRLLPALALWAAPAIGIAQEAASPRARTASAVITVDLADTTAGVEALYRVEGRLPVELRSFRIPDQEVRDLVAESGSLPSGVERRPGLTRITFGPPTDPIERDRYHRRLRVPVLPSWELRVAYRVTGDLDRVPLFVPAPAADADSRLEVRVRGLDPEAELQAAFPRFAWSGEGGGPPTAVARPPSLPTFVALPAGTPLLTLDAAADLLVVLVVLGATGWWLLWRRRAARRVREAGGDVAGPDP